MCGVWVVSGMWDGTSGQIYIDGLANEMSDHAIGPLDILREVR